jgi:Protein of unknown function (DUF3303)
LTPDRIIYSARSEIDMLYTIVEQFKNDDPMPVYRRFRDRGRLAPDGLIYISSWVDENMQRCYQLMETEDRDLIDLWVANWSDLVDFEIYPVMTSQAAIDRIALYLMWTMPLKRDRYPTTILKL